MLPCNSLQKVSHESMHKQELGSNMGCPTVRVSQDYKIPIFIIVGNRNSLCLQDRVKQMVLNMSNLIPVWATASVDGGLKYISTFEQFHPILLAQVLRRTETEAQFLAM
jgi:hypothetical protein